MQQLLNNNKLILLEGAIIEQLRRNNQVTLHPELLNAPLIYDKAGSEVLASLYQNYIDIATKSGKPFLMCTPTWRTNRERVNNNKVSSSINTDAVGFMQMLREKQANKDQIKIGGLLGCKNDCYLPEEGLTATEAEEFHTWQAEQLAKAGVDFLMAATLPNIEEALGLARTIEKTKLPYLISFVIARDGNILDGTTLQKAFAYIDNYTSIPPLGYLINCAYPTFLNAGNQAPEVFDRLIGYQANASSLDHCDLDGAENLEMEKISDWGNEMLKLNQEYGVKILGGCCGTGPGHLQYLVDN